MKTIIIHDNGNVECPELTDQEKLAVGQELFPDMQTDNYGQYIFYTDINETDS